MACTNVNEMDFKDASPMVKNLEQLEVILSGPAAPRAVLVSMDLDGGKTLRYQPVKGPHSVLNIKTELLNHLADYPFSDAWLLELRDYVDQRLSARADARARGEPAFA